MFSRLRNRRFDFTYDLTPRQRFYFYSRIFCPECMPYKHLFMSIVIRASIPSIANDCPFCALIYKSFQHFIGGDHDAYVYDMHISKTGELQLCFYESTDPLEIHTHIQLHSPGVFFPQFHQLPTKSKYRSTRAKTSAWGLSHSLYIPTIGWTNQKTQGMDRSMRF
jgi:hypothetical protein